VRLRAKIDSSPEMKMRIMWVLDKLPIVKNSLKKIGKIEEKRDIEEYSQLSQSSQEIYAQLKNKIEVKR